MIVRKSKIEIENLSRGFNDGRESSAIFLTHSPYFFTQKFFRALS